MVIIIAGLLIYNISLRKQKADQEKDMQDMFGTQINNTVSNGNNNQDSSKDETRAQSFIATVLEANIDNKYSIMVKPEEGTTENKSSDKIVVSYDNPDNITFEKGSKVKIEYDGLMLETYPAQIRAGNVELVN